MARPNALLQNLMGELRRHLTASFLPGEQIPSTRALAAMYGVGAMTVHRALRLLADDNILAAGPRQGWIRRRTAGLQPARVRSRLRVGLISPLTHPEWQNNRFYKLLADEARRRKVELIEVPNLRSDRTTPARARVDLQRVPWNQFDLGLLVDTEDSRTLSDPLLAQRRVLTVDRDATPYGLDSVTFDNVGAGRVAARYLYELGHRRFGVTDETSEPGWPSEQTWLARRHGFESETGFLGGCIRPEWRLPFPRSGFQSYHFGALRSAIAGWGRAPRKQRPTAIFCFEDSVASTILTELAKHNLSVPRDMSILSISGRIGKPPKSGEQYSFVWLEFTTLARRTFDAVEELSRELPSARKARAPRLYTTPVLLVPGGSTRPPARAD
jgi:DNA-binding LacI/PurR family transcriptional regulator